MESRRVASIRTHGTTLCYRMIRFNLEASAQNRLKILCLGSHSDDIEIGCGGTVLRLAELYPYAELHWAVFSASGIRESEARRAAELFASTRLRGTIFKNFPDGFMPYVGADVKAVFEHELKVLSPDLIFTHNRMDAHQDHRVISELTWNTFRDHFILEYEIPKYEATWANRVCSCRFRLKPLRRKCGLSCRRSNRSVSSAGFKRTLFTRLCEYAGWNAARTAAMRRRSIAESCCCR